MLCAVVGDNDHWEKYSAEAQRMRAAMMDYLFNDDTGAFVLNYDQDGNYQDNFTADEIFPVLFGIADPTQRRAILARLLEADFVTPVGLRTISTADAWYFPSYGFGLLGGKFLEGVARQPELSAMLMIRMFIMAGLLDAFAAISVVIGLMLFYAENPFLNKALAVAKTVSGA